MMLTSSTTPPLLRLRHRNLGTSNAVGGVHPIAYDSNGLVQHFQPIAGRGKQELPHIDSFRRRIDWPRSCSSKCELATAALTAGLGHIALRKPDLACLKAGAFRRLYNFRYRDAAERRHHRGMDRRCGNRNATELEIPCRAGILHHGRLEPKSLAARVVASMHIWLIAPTTTMYSIGRGTYVQFAQRKSWGRGDKIRIAADDAIHLMHGTR